MCFEEGESWRGQIGEWPTGYIHKEPGNRYEHVREGDKVQHIPTSEPRSWLHVGEFGVWEIELMKFAGEFGYHEHGKFWKGGKEPISLFDLPLTMPNQTKSDTPVPKPDTFLKKVESFLEGQEIVVEQTLYERNPEARRVCINHFGLNCQVCGLNFEKVYGEMGAGFIHVHHVNPISTKGGEYEVNPITDLVPLCPNCHAMAHRRMPPYSIEELKAIYFRE